MTTPSRGSTIKLFRTAEKVTAVLRLLKGESLDELSAELGVAAHRLVRWQDDFIRGGSAALGRRKGSGPVDWLSKHAAAIFQSVAVLIVVAITIGIVLTVRRGE